eukprot:8747347-Alexandrium_andersonii.AAC.1
MSWTSPPRCDGAADEAPRRTPLEPSAPSLCGGTGLSEEEEASEGPEGAGAAGGEAERRRRGLRPR